MNQSAGLALLLALCAGQAVAVTSPVERLPDPALEGRARELSKELRCLVCQNQSIDDSDAELARDLRRIVREQLAAGRDEGQIRTYLVDRYGDFVLLSPPVRRDTYLLWAGPFLVLGAGAVLAVLWLRRRRPAMATPAAAPLTGDERRELDRLLTGERPG